MTSLPANAMLPLIKTALIPIILISIFLRNRRQRRQRAEAQDRGRDRRAASSRTPFNTAESRADVLDNLLARFDAGEAFAAPTGPAVTRGLIANRLAAALLADGDLEEAEHVLTGTLDATDTAPEDRRQALMQMARLRVGQDRLPDARTCLSEAADLHLARLRSEARGDILHLAERLADFVATPDLTDPKLPDYGPLTCLQLAGRDAEAREVAADLVARIDRALAETADDPEGRVDGFPRDLLVGVRGRLAAFALRD